MMNFFRRVSLRSVISSSVALSLLVLGTQAVGSVPVFAGAYVTLDSFSGTPGSTITVSGGGWNAGDTLALYEGSTAGTPVASTTVQNDSTFSLPLVISASASQGPLAITAVDTKNSYQAGNSYYVVPLTPTITDTAASHAPYAVVSVSGSGYAPNETISLALASATSTVMADGKGSFSGSVTVPMVSSGLYHLVATGSISGASTFDYFWIDQFYPSVSPSTYYLMPGASLSFTGSGFATGEPIAVTQTGTSTSLATITADATGAFTSAGSFVVPPADHGTVNTFTLTGQKSGQQASVQVTVGDYYAYTSPTAYYLLPGQTETFSGGGFAGGEKVDVYAGIPSGSSTPAATITTDQQGGFLSAGSIAVPFSALKNLTFTLIGELSRAQAQTTIAVGGYYPTLSPSSYYVTPNTSITIAGSGFAPSEGITLTVAGTATSTAATTTAMGTFSVPVVIPFSSTGSASITASGNQSGAVGNVSVALAKFYPIATPSSWFVYPGGGVSFTGTGFVPNESVTVTTGTASSTQVTADAYGTVHTATTTVPYEATGSLITTLTGSLSQSPTSVSIAVGTLSPYLSADRYAATQGETVHVQGFSFAPGEVITVSAGSFATTTVADANGTTPFVPVVAPYSTSSLKVTFTGASSKVSSSLSVSLLSFNAYITSSAYYALPGTPVTITGTGFAPNEAVSLADGIATTTVSATPTGSFSAPLTLPFTGGSSLMVVATGHMSGASSALAIAYAPYIPQVAPSTYYTLPGTTVTFTGSGFAPNESVTVTFNAARSTSVQADAAGSFSYPYQIPFGSTKAVLSFMGQTSGAGVTDTLSLAQYAAYISLSSYYGVGGSAETVTGSGFAPNEPVTLAFNGVNFDTTTATALGTITAATTVPFSTAGTKPLSATGSQSGVVAGTNFTVAQLYPGFTLDTYAGAPGTVVRISGTGFLPNESVSITTDRTGSTAVATGMTDAAGNLSNVSYLLPKDFLEGTLVFTVIGQHSLTPRSITYYVTGS
jgi:hypothetical protein